MVDATIPPRPKKGGEWRPSDPLLPPVLWRWPPDPKAVFKWIFGWGGFLYPWNAAYLAIAVATWYFLTPPLEAMKTWEFGWVGLILGRNLVLLVLVVGVWHTRLYVQQAQDMDYKYSGRWLAKGNSFWFKSQIHDNVFWSLCSAVPIWTAFEVVTFWGQANGYFPAINWSEHPVYCVLMFPIILFWREVHFYLVHRLLHVKWLYGWCHSLHHANVVPGPWSGLSMHPVEHLIYFSSIMLHWVIPAHPLHIVFSMQQSAFTPSQGHSGFHKIKVGDTIELENENLLHYLHHRYFEVNYGGFGLVPLDKWMGTYHDGTEESHRLMNERILARTTEEQRGQVGDS